MGAVDVECLPAPSTPPGEPPQSDTDTESESTCSSSGSAEELGSPEECRKELSHRHESNRPRDRERSPRRLGSRLRAKRETLILMDWDDTLMPSTWLLQQGLRIDGGPPSPEQQEQLDRAARESARTLRAAKRLGCVVVITNAETGWVELSCQKFVPSLQPLLEGVKIRSARSAYERPDVSSPLSWKQMAFSDELEDFSASVRGHGLTANIVSLGDSVHERGALLFATQDAADCWGKSVKFMERPQLDLFSKQHRFASKCLKPIIRHKGKLDLRIRFAKAVA